MFRRAVPNILGALDPGTLIDLAVVCTAVGFMAGLVLAAPLIGAAVGALLGTIVLHSHSLDAR